MIRLIDADALIKDTWFVVIKGENIDDISEQIIRQCKRIVSEAPTIDAASVVRCKECKHTYKWDSGCGAELVCKARRCDPSDWGNDRIEFYVKADDFCSYGERGE